MNKSMMLMLTGVLAFGVLTACGNPKENAHSDGHGSSHQTDTNSPAATASHGEHSGHDGGEKSAASYKASFSFASEAVKGNEQVQLSIQISDTGGNPVNEFELNHEKLMHLIIVNKDLAYFKHIHPEFSGNGTFTIDTTFPNGGEYKLFADFVPSNGSGTTLSEWVKIEGEPKAEEGIIADTNRVKVVYGKEVELALSSTKAKEETMLTFTISDAQTKQGISDLEQYLGAVGHVVILSEDAEQYLHVHPMDEKATGPKAEFMTAFPNPGTYKIWGQFQHQGKVFTIPFVVDIQ
ncbi:hypothetical protein [Cohnella boryungensis]|uniref:Secreted protein n=1 Tax=Cohnella boryungensis TaxID=768479 RepID=A0ABV8SJ60_9BACL